MDSVSAIGPTVNASHRLPTCRYGSRSRNQVKKQLTRKINSINGSARSTTSSRSSTHSKKRKPLTLDSKSGQVVDSPPDITFDKYQVTSVHWLLANPFAALLLDPGLGKTVITLMAFYLLRRAKAIDWILVVAPLRPCYLVWPEEVKKFGFNFKVSVLHEKGKELIDEPADIYVINFEGLEWLHDKIPQLRARGQGWLVVDESDSVKNINSLRHRLLKTMMDCFSRRTLLTGTPMPNGYLDLFGQIYLLDAGKRLGIFITHYKSLHFQAFTMQDRVLATREEQKLHKRHIQRWEPTKAGKKFIDNALKDICLRFSDRELGLKKPRWQTIEVELPDKARRIYDQLDNVFMAAFEEEGFVLALNSGALGIKLRQVCNGGVIDNEDKVHELHTAKADALVELVSELQGEPILAGYEFDADRDRFVQALAKAGMPEIPVISGGMKMKQQIAILNRFNAGFSPILLAQYQTVSHGLNLQANCKHVCFTGMIWNLGTYIQFMRRVYRKGQKGQVIVHEIVARNTRDEVVVEGRKSKDKTQSRFLKLLERYRREHID
jgi:SNF2 family DNA or RNA helicase